MKRSRRFFWWLPGGRRPPTGPLTTEEAADAEQLRQKTAPKNDETTGHEQKDAPGLES